MTVNNELVRLWKEEVVDHIKVILHKIPAGI
jgi:hypothetical protein